MASGYYHGIKMSENETSLLTVNETSSVPIVFVTAPINMADDPYGVTNKPKLCYTKSEAVGYFGHSTAESIWENYTGPQVIRAAFELYGKAPVILVNVLNPEKHVITENFEINSADGNELIISDVGVLADTITFGDGSISPDDCSFGFNDNGEVVITYNGENALNEVLPITASYSKLNPSAVTYDDFIGGYDSNTGTYSGLELIDNIYTMFRVVPSIIAVPGYSKNATLAAVMETKAEGINSLFKASVLVDLPTLDDNGVRYTYTETAALKNDKSITGIHTNALWPMVGYDGYKYYMSSHMLGIYMATDYANDDIPYKAPSNEKMYIDSIIDENGEEINLNLTQANYLNEQGITTAINFIDGWVSWGVQTAAYPGSSDVKDNTICVRRMFDYINNDFILSYWSKIDEPINRRLIDRIVDDYNIKLNSLVADGKLLGGRIEFLEAENSTTDLISGKIKFKTAIAPPPAAREIEDTLEYDTDYLSTLFS